LHAMLSHGYHWSICLYIIAMEYRLDKSELSEAYTALQTNFE
jgi:hypothetical protein